jgi:hypothetical protein
MKLKPNVPNGTLYEIRLLPIENEKFMLVIYEAIDYLFLSTQSGIVKVDISKEDSGDISQNIPDIVFYFMQFAIKSKKLVLDNPNEMTDLLSEFQNDLNIAKEWIESIFAGVDKEYDFNLDLVDCVVDDNDDIIGYANNVTNVDSNWLINLYICDPTNDGDHIDVFENHLKKIYNLSTLLLYYDQIDYNIVKAIQDSKEQGAV